MNPRLAMSAAIIGHKSWVVLVCLLGGLAGFAQEATGLRVGTAAVELEADNSMTVAGGIHPGKAAGQEGLLRAVAVVLEKPPFGKLAIVACDILMITREHLDPAVHEIETATGIPAERILINATKLGLDIKNRSPFRHTYVAELANDWIGYLPDRDAHKLGGYRVWTGYHSFAEVGTGERMVDEVVAMLGDLAREGYGGDTK